MQSALPERGEIESKRGGKGEFSFQALISLTGRYTNGNRGCDLSMRVENKKGDTKVSKIRMEFEFHAEFLK